jgi:glucokinase
MTSIFISCVSFNTAEDYSEARGRVHARGDCSALMREMPVSAVFHQNVSSCAEGAAVTKVKA